MPESSQDKAARFAREFAKINCDALVFGEGFGLSGIILEHLRRADVYARPPLHGATDYRRGPDGVWEMPR